MALFKIFKGNDINRLNNPDDPNYKIPIDGYAYYNIDNQEFYIDANYGGKKDENNEPIITRKPINAHYAYSAGYDGASSPQRIDKTYIKGISISSNNQLSYTLGDGTSHTVEGTLGAVTGVKGNAETTYRTGQVNLTPANIGAATSGHTHTTTIATDNGTNQLTLAFGTKYKLTAGGTSYIFTMPANPDTNTASAVDNILNGSNSGTAITYAPYTSQQAKLSFDISTTNPTRTDRLNLNGYLYATKIYSGGQEVLTAHQSLTNYKTKQTAIETMNAETDSATRFVYSITQNDNGEITVKTRPLPTYNNYTLPKATDGALGGIKTGYSASGKNYAIKVDTDGNAYVNVPWENTHQDISGKANLNSPAFTGTPTAPTAANGTNNTQIATTAFVMNAFTANDAMVFKGVLGTESGMIATLPTTHLQGWTYKVGTAGTYAGQVCEVGDTIYCVADGTAANNAHWVILQTNVDGTVIGPATSTADHIVTFTGTTGKVIKDSGFTIATSVPANAKFTDTDTKVTSVDNHYTPSANTNSELTASLSGTAGSYALNTEYTVLTGIKAQRDAKGHVTGLTYTAQKIKDTNTTYTLAGLMGSTAKGSQTKPIYWDGSKFAAITSYEGKATTAGTADKTTAANLTTTTNAIAKYSDTAGTFADSGVTIDANNNITAPTTAYIKAGTFQIGGSGQKVTNKIKSSDTFYIDRADQMSIIFQYNGANKIWIDQPNNNFRPDVTNSLNIGTTTYAWKSVFISTNATTDNGLAFSNGSNVLGRIGVNTSGAMALSVPDGQGIHLRPHPTNTNLDFIVNKNEVQLLNIPKINLTDNSDGTKSVSIVFNSTTNALDFIFA